MRHRVSTKRLRRNSAHRKAMVRNLLTSLFLHGKVKTTDARAKVLRSEVEKVFSQLKRTDQVNQIRFLKGLLFDQAASRLVLEEYLAKYKAISSGYTRTTRVGIRKGDNATLIQVELV